MGSSPALKTQLQRPFHIPHGVRRVLSTEAEGASKAASTSAPPSSSNTGTWVVLGAVSAISGAGVFILGAPVGDVDESLLSEEQKSDLKQGYYVPPKLNNFDDANPVSAYFLRAWNKFNQVIEDRLNPLEENSLPPLLPAQYRPSDYTIVLDLEDTLIHSSWSPEHGWAIVKRPGVDLFLEHCAINLFEVVIFSDKTASEALPILQKLDPQGLATYKLFRNHKRFINGEWVKDLSLLGRDLKKVILVDDDPKNCQLQPCNSLLIKKFDGNAQDNVLFETLPFLEALVESQTNDVRLIFKRYKEKGVTDVAGAFHQINLELIEKQKAKRLEQQALAAAAPRKKGFFGF